MIKDRAMNVQNNFSTKTFAVGIILIVSLFIVTAGALYLQKNKTLTRLQENLASQTLLISGEIVNTHPQPEDLNTSDLVKAPPHGENETPVHVDEETLDSNFALTPAPIPGYFVETASGKMPIKQSASQTPFTAYKRPYPFNIKPPFLSVVIDDFGLSTNNSTQAIKDLPPSVSYILSPYSADTQKWVDDARKNGHEVWLKLPVENKEFPQRDPGAKGLLTRVSLEYNQDRLKWILSSTTGYAGIAAYTDHTLASASTMFKNVARDIFDRGLGFFELNTTEQSFFAPIAEDSNIPMISNPAIITDFNLDNPAVKNIKSNITNNGGAIIVVTPTPQNITALKTWLETINNEAVISQIPLSAIAALNQD